MNLEQDTAIPEQVKTFFSSFSTAAFQKNQLLIHAGDDAQYIYYIEQGVVRQYDITDQGTEVIVNKYKPGAFFPMLSAITHKPNTFFFAADADVLVRRAPPEEVLRFLHENPPVMFDLLTRLYTGVDGLLGRMAQLMAGDARKRLVYELLIEMKRFGTKQATGSYTLTIRETDLGAASGLSRETVSRELQKLAHDGLLTRARNSITVPNLAALEAISGSGL